MDQGSKTALGSAKERFLAGLARRLTEIEPSIQAVRADPRSPFAQADLQRRLHALLASSQLFEQVELAAVLQRATSRLDAVVLGMAQWSADIDQTLDAVLSELRRASELFAPSDDDVRTEVRPQRARLGRTLPPMAATPAAELPPPPLAHAKRQPLEPPSLGQARAAMLVRVLLVCSRPHAAELRALLDDAPLQLLHAADPEQALVLLHMAAPACAFVAAEFATLPDIDLVRRLQTDPLSRLDGAYLLLPAGASYDAEFLRQTGADGVLVEPLSVETLAPVIERATRRRGRGGLRALRSQSEGTVDEIASFVAEEIRSGISESLRSGLHERIRLGEAIELADVAKSAISRVRMHLAEQSEGRVSFGSERQAQPRAEHEVDGVEALPEPSIKLQGTRVLVVDDDPAVLWFFAGLLREAGADVLQAQDGREALELARRKRPHLVLSDILMPKIDGFALCRELRRDALLEHVPMILLSWKEDLLERMRELDAGASGYLRKEAGHNEVLNAVATALQSRLQLVAALREPGEVSGRVEDVGIVPLLESVAHARPDARISLQDAWNLFEVDLRDGQRLAVTRTAADGSFARGERALVQLLGVNAGRFSVVANQLALRGALEESFASALEKAGKALAAVLAAVSDTRLVHVALLSFEDEVLDLLLSCTPTRLHEVVERFRRADVSAQQLLLEGSFTPAELESHLRELARRGAINGVWNAQGDDLLEAARREREDQPGSLLHASSPRANPAWFSSLSSAAASHEPAPPERTELADEQTPVDNPLAEFAQSNETPDDALAAPPDAAAIEAPSASERVVELARPSNPAPAPRTRERLKLIFTLAALAALGYVGQRFVASGGELTTTFNALIAKHVPSAAPPVRSPEPAQRQVVEGERLPYIDAARGVDVAANQGLIAIEYAGGAPAPRVSIDGQDLGAPPIALALSAMQHELTVQVGLDAAQRLLNVRAGETCIITLPLPPE